MIARNPQRRRIANLSVAILIVLSVSAYGDGINLDYFVRFPVGEHSLTYVWSMIIVLMAANYALNFLVIGWPAIRIGSISVRKVSLGLIILTLLGQIADRIGAFLALIALSPFLRQFKRFGDQLHLPTKDVRLGQWLWEHPWFWGHLWLMFNLIFSGLAVALLTWLFLRRWSVPQSLRWKITVAAAIFTNPAWALALLTLRA